MSDIISLLTMAFVLIMAFWQNTSTILRAIAVPIAFVYGFYNAGQEAIFTPIWVANVGIGLVGFYLFYQLAAEAISNFIRKK